jgi:hypothetical protein
MVIDRVPSSLMKPQGSYRVVATPLDGRGRAYVVRGQPKGMTYVQAHDFGQEYARHNDVAIDIEYKGAR